jgi:hypothetical protein
MEEKKSTAKETIKKLSEIELQCLIHGNQPCTCYSGGSK